MIQLNLSTTATLGTEESGCLNWCKTEVILGDIVEETKEQSSHLGHESVEGYIGSKSRHQGLSKQCVRLFLIYLVVAIVSIFVVESEFPYVRKCSLLQHQSKVSMI